MPSSSRSNSASPQQLFSHARRHGYPFHKTRAGTTTTLIHSRSSLPTPTTSISGCETTNISNHGHPDAASPLPNLNHVPKPIDARMQRLQDVCEWSSKVEPGTPASEEKESEGFSRGTYRSQSEPTTVQAHLRSPKAPGFGASELDPGHIFGGVVDELTKTAVEKFGSVHPIQSRKRSISPGPDKCRKRSRLGSCHDPTSAGLIGDLGGTNTGLAKHNAEAAQRIWPCPFYVRDRKSYRSCWTRHCLLSVGDVQEHLCTVHLEPIHCSVCYKTFQTVRLRDEHMRTRECHFQLPYGFDGLRDSQVRELQRQGTAEDKAPALQERQWVKMWCIVFSCTRRPQSPFSFSQQELAVCEFRRFWERHGEHIIADVLAKHGLQQYDIENEERSLEALSSLVADHAVDHLLPTEDTRTP